MVPAPARRRPGRSSTCSRPSDRRNSSPCCRRSSVCAPATWSSSPTLAYPSYAVGAAVVGATVIASDDPDDWPGETRLVWLNSPGNPDGRVHGPEFLKRAVRRARDLGAVIANDECYTELNWAGDEPTPSILDPSCHRRQPTADALGVVAQQAVQPGRLPGGFRRRVQRPDRRTSRGAQAPRTDAAGAGAGGDDRGPGRRRPRERAARAVPRAPRDHAGGSRACGVPHRRERRRPVPLGDPWRGLLGDASGRWPTTASWSRRATSTASRRTARAGRAHGDGRGCGEAARRLEQFSKH